MDENIRYGVGIEDNEDWGPISQFPTSVVNIKKEKADVFVGRGSKWGNPFKLGRDGNRETVIGKYREWVKSNPDLMHGLHVLKGKKLGCFCKPLSCHGDVLVELIKERCK